MLMTHAAELHLPPSEASLEVSTLTKLFDIKYESVQPLLDAFAKIDTRKTGKLTIDEFCDVMQVPDNALGLRRRLFQLLDVHDTGYLDFREYLIGLSALQSDKEAAGRLAFRICDMV